MSYQALYRKYRPRDLNEVYGQDIVVNILKNAVEKNKFTHAYLFTGPRGCGKTSVAKILARMINCTDLKNGITCGKCDNCKISASNTAVDIIEIDAASNNGVDEIRELKSKINLIPTSLKYKVYIIDEVHMLSTGAFNALLKTLEEPPEHVVFILATTELDKVPTTIVSRCQTMEFKKINNRYLITRLKEIAIAENININDEAVEEIAFESDGGLRDAIGLLDMASSYSTQEITIDDIYTIRGNISSNEINELTKKIIEKDIDTIENKVNEYYYNGKDLIKIVEKIILSLKEYLFKNSTTNIYEILEYLLDASEKMKNSSIPKIYLDLAIFKICEQKNEEKKLIKEENKSVEEKKVKTTSDVQKPQTPNNEIAKIRINNALAGANKKILVEIKEKWNDLNNYTFNRDYGALVCELIDLIPVAASEEYLILSSQYESFVAKGNSNFEKYEEVLKSTISVDKKIVFITSDGWQNEKKVYIEKIKNNNPYTYIEEKKQKKYNRDESDKKYTNSDMLEKATELFDTSKIVIN